MPHKRDMIEGQASESPSPALLSAVEELAARPSVASALRFFGKEKRWIHEQHLELCRVAAPTFREQQRAEFLVRLFRDLGHASRIDEAGNVVTAIVFDKCLPYVAVTAHMDTVLSPQQLGDVSVDPDGTMLGPGVTDNGAGLAALAALHRVAVDGLSVPRPRRNILLAANVAEEGEGNLHGMKYLCRHSPYASKIEAFLVLDGASTGHITVEGLGSRRFEITIEGPGGHSWNDFGRANPVHALGRTVAVLADAELPISPRTTLSVGVIEGGSGVNSISSLARAKVDIRSRSADAMQGVVEQMEEAVKLGVELENRRADDRLSHYKIREIGNRPAAPPLENSDVTECIQAADAYLGIRSRLDCASTDANIPLAMGIPAAAIGAGGRGGGAHTTSEWYHPQGRELGLQRVLLTVLQMID